MSRIDSLTQIRVRLTHVTTQVSPTSLERIQQAWAGVPMQMVRVSFKMPLHDLNESRPELKENDAHIPNLPNAQICIFSNVFSVCHTILITRLSDIHHAVALKKQPPECDCATTNPTDVFAIDRVLLLILQSPEEDCFRDEKLPGEDCLSGFVFARGGLLPALTNVPNCPGRQRQSRHLLRHELHDMQGFACGLQGFACGSAKKGSPLCCACSFPHFLGASSALKKQGSTYGPDHDINVLAVVCALKPAGTTMWTTAAAKDERLKLPRTTADRAGIF
jgi:hypothetical protein